MCKTTYVLISLFLCISGVSFSQFGFEYDNSIIVNRNGNPLENPWGGGLNYVQISDFDYDFDGDLDLLLFDRSSNNLRVFTQEDQGGTKFYQLAYNARNNFPSDVRYRAIMVDYDNDGRKDLWTYGIGGLKIYRNVGSVGTGIQWELITELLSSVYVNGPSQLYVSSSDLPAIVDVDSDGDIDVLTFHQGGENIEYHQNQSMELYGIPDSLIFEVKNECWGLFSEDFLTNSITLNETNFPCTGSSIPNPLRTGNNSPVNDETAKKHAGSTLLAIDMNNSGVYDLVLGDVTFPTLTLLMNGGTAPNTNSAMISEDPSFPSNTTPASMQLFPAPFYVDVDFDGVKDLVVTANARNISENETSVQFYKNIGTNDLPNFIYSANNWLQNQMIEHGTGSVPVFFDFDEDGLKDLFVANNFRYIPTLDKESTIAYYKNTGTANAPEYTYIDYNFLNLDQENYGLRSIPAFGDIDGDGDEDLFIGIQDGTLVFYPNNSVGAGAVFGTPQSNYTDNNATVIQCDGYAHPQLFDLNDDGLLDLIIGTKTGEIQYYENIGTANAPSFELTNSQLGNISLAGANPNMYAAPHFFRLNNETKLFLGSFDGELIYYDTIDGNLGTGAPFSLVSDHYVDIDVQAYSSFAVEDVNNDGNLNLFVGQDLGGLFHFEADPNSDVSIDDLNLSNDVAMYPNPSSQTITIASAEQTVVGIQILNMNGAKVYNESTFSKKKLIDIRDLSNGIYVIQIALDNGNIVTKKLVKN